MIKIGDIRKMLNPETIALIGATEEEGSVGRTIMENLLLSKDRRIFPVNPNYNCKEKSMIACLKNDTYIKGFELEHIVARFNATLALED